jgi:hypothetical protein
MTQQEAEKTKHGKKFIDFFMKYKILQTNFRLVIVSIFLLSLLHFAIALWMYGNGRSLLDLKLKISDLCFTNPCDLRFRIVDKYDGPVFVYIGYDNFYLNHRKIINSVDSKQLEGKSVTADDIKNTCMGFETVNDARRLLPNKFANWTGSDILYPCGLLPLMFTQCEINSQLDHVPDGRKLNHCNKRTANQRHQPREP